MQKGKPAQKNNSQHADLVLEGGFKNCSNLRSFCPLLLWAEIFTSQTPHLIDLGPKALSNKQFVTYNGPTFVTLGLVT